MTNLERIKQRCKEVYDRYGMTSKIYTGMKTRDKMRCSGVIAIETFSEDDKVRHEFIRDCRLGLVLFGWKDLTFMKMHRL